MGPHRRRRSRQASIRSRRPLVHTLIDSGGTVEVTESGVSSITPVIKILFAVLLGVAGGLWGFVLLFGSIWSFDASDPTDLWSYVYVLVLPRGLLGVVAGLLAPRTWYVRLVGIWDLPLWIWWRAWEFFVTPGWAVLLLPAAILGANYIGATLRPVQLPRPILVGLILLLILLLLIVPLLY